MALPTFLGIGAPRSGTTWLHELLKSHPEVYVPQRKEVRFFELYYDRGLQWYEDIFPSYPEERGYKAIGEFSPGYLYYPNCPERIAKVSSISHLILILRNPIDRAYSDYGLRVRYRDFAGPFEDFLPIEPEVVEMGHYSVKIKDYLQHFGMDQLLVLIFENAVNDVPGTKRALANFLGLAIDQFPSEAGVGRINESFVPKWRPIPHQLTTFVASRLLEWDWQGVFRLANKVGDMFGKAGTLPPMKPETRQKLAELYAPEIEALEELLERDLAVWKA